MKKIIWVVVLVVAAVVVVAVGVWFVNGGKMGGENTADSVAAKESGATIATTSASSDNGLSNGMSLAADAAAYAEAPLNRVYTDATYGFSVNYPEGLTETVLPGDDSSPSAPKETVLIEDENGLGFQVAVSPFAEDNPNITPDRILEDVPDMVINSPAPVNLGNGRGQGTTFLDGAPNDPNTNRQIWFAGGGYLYQITSMPVFDAAMQKILKTWELK